MEIGNDGKVYHSSHGTDENDPDFSLELLKATTRQFQMFLRRRKEMYVRVHYGRCVVFSAVRIYCYLEAL